MFIVICMFSMETFCYEVIFFSDKCFWILLFILEVLLKEICLIIKSKP